MCLWTNDFDRWKPHETVAVQSFLAIHKKQSSRLEVVRIVVVETTVFGRELLTWIHVWRKISLSSKILMIFICKTVVSGAGMKKCRSCEQEVRWAGESVIAREREWDDSTLVFSTFLLRPKLREFTRLLPQATDKASHNYYLALNAE